MKIKTYKVFSLCKDFDSDIYPEMYEELSQHNTCNSFIEYEVRSAKYLKENNYGDDPSIRERLIKLGAKDGETVLIHIDY